MKTYRTLFFILILGPFLTLQTNAQVDTTHTANYLVKEILIGTGVLVGNVSFTGEKHAIGLFFDSTRQIGIEQGIVLTSGNAIYMNGPNKNPRSGWASNAPGDPELEKIAKGKTFDASILEFDFVTSSEFLSFEYVFASEEYLEYVGSKFNDVFAFFLTDPAGNKSNIAHLPDGVTPITVNTVNHEKNTEYYIDNAYINTTDPFVWDVRNRKVITNIHYQKSLPPPKYYTQFDGFTQVLKVNAFVSPNKVYHIKLAIADVGDGILDSGVILKAGSFMSSGEQKVPISYAFPEDLKPVEKQKAELKTSTSPSTIASTPKKMPERFSNVEFEFDRFELTQSGREIVKHVYNQWKAFEHLSVQIDGHTDNFGSDKYNLTLSKHRVETVAFSLIELGVPPERLKMNFFGESRPIKSNDDEFGRARNRRVELKLVN